MMRIDRFELVNRHNPILEAVDFGSPLTVGNGTFAFTADVTGMQTLYKEYADAHAPLCTMSEWGWHSAIDSKENRCYTKDELVWTKYHMQERVVTYPSKCHEGNEQVYHWLRHNPHRCDLACVRLQYKGQPVSSDQLSNIHQELFLWKGFLESDFQIDHNSYHIETACHPEFDQLGFRINAKEDAIKELSVLIEFPYGSHDITGADFGAVDRHSTQMIGISEHQIILQRCMDDLEYEVIINVEHACSLQLQEHCLLLIPKENSLNFSVEFNREHDRTETTDQPLFKESAEYWQQYWRQGGAIDLHLSEDPRALELERRLVLSQYLLAVQCCGNMPPQETGLTCNSWYGKFHLEMHPWHSAWLPLWSRGERLKKSLGWYEEILPKARENAERNGYRGVRWPKMVAYDGEDSPSEIAPLLIWQQPHLIFMLELLYQEHQDEKILTEYWPLVKATAEFMADFMCWNEEKAYYELCPPIIPAQEEHAPEDTKNPTFELAYFQYGLQTAALWGERLGEAVPEWKEAASKIAPMPSKDNLYLAHENCPDTYLKYNKDHPSMVAPLGLLPGDGIDAEIMEKTVKKVLECWDMESLWGWDFAMLAMTAVRLHKPDLAMDLLLMDSPKNTYVTSGNNFQKLRQDLPLYLPGNGSLLLAMAQIVGGYADCTDMPGIPKDGKWVVLHEGIKGFPR